MRLLSHPFEVPRRLRAIVRARESSVIVLAVIIGAIAGLAVAAMGEAVGLMHQVFFGLDPGERLQVSFRSIRFTLSCRLVSAGCCSALSLPTSRDGVVPK